MVFLKLGYAYLLGVRKQALGLASSGDGRVTV